MAPFLIMPSALMIQNIIMKFLSHMRSKSRLNRNDEDHAYQSRIGDSYAAATPPIPRRGVTLPDGILKKILAFVCPHTHDDSYVTSEDSMIDGGCMLCDMRDLAQCALVRKAWGEAGALLLYVNRKPPLSTRLTAPLLQIPQCAYRCCALL